MQGRIQDCCWGDADFENIDVDEGYPLKQQFITFDQPDNCITVIFVNVLDFYFLSFPPAPFFLICFFFEVCTAPLHTHLL